MRDLLDLLAEYGFTDVEPVQTVQEKDIFLLPKNLQSDMKAWVVMTKKLFRKSSVFYS